MAMNFKNMLILVMLAVLLSACTLEAGIQTPAEPATTQSPTAPVEQPTAGLPPTQDLTLADLKNATYTVSFFDGEPQSFTLNNGMYQNGTDPAIEGYLSAFMSDNSAFGDLNGDGLADAVTIIAFNTGGTGVFMHLFAMLNQGAPVQVGSYFIDDRAIINSLAIDNGEIILDAIVHGVEDPGCCPTFAVRRTYRLMERLDYGLVMTSQSSRLSGGQERIITIENPLDGANEGSPVNINGSVTIAPFENTLVYRIFDPATGKELKAGPIMVNAPDLGAPGTFEASITLDIAPAGPYIRIQVEETSMADGSLLAMDSVTLRVP